LTYDSISSGYDAQDQLRQTSKGYLSGSRGKLAPCRADTITKAKVLEHPDITMLDLSIWFLEKTGVELGSSNL